MPRKHSLRFCSRAAAVLLVVLLALAAHSTRAEDPPAQAPPEETPETLVEQGVDLFAQGKAEKALAAFTRADKLAGGKSLAALVGWARAALAASNYRDAEQAARRALDLHESAIDSAAAHNLLGIALLGDMTAKPKELAEAERAFRKAVELSEGKVVAPRFSLAKTLELQGRKAEAMAQVRETIAAGAEGDLRKQSRVLLCGLRASLAEEGGEPPLAPAGSAQAPPFEPAAASLLTEAPRRVEGEISPPGKLLTPLPRYPDSDRRSGKQGVVVAEAIIDQEGCVTHVEVLRSLSPGLDRATIRAVERWVFEPAKLNGKLVKVYYTLTVNFQLQP